MKSRTLTNAELCLLLLWRIGLIVALAGLIRRVSALESKPCLLTGAHVGCERGGAR